MKILRAPLLGSTKVSSHSKVRTSSGIAGNPATKIIGAKGRRVKAG